MSTLCGRFAALFMSRLSPSTRSTTSSTRRAGLRTIVSGLISDILNLRPQRTMILSTADSPSADHDGHRRGHPTVPPSRHQTRLVVFERLFNHKNPVSSAARYHIHDRLPSASGASTGSSVPSTFGLSNHDSPRAMESCRAPVATLIVSRISGTHEIRRGIASLGQNQAMVYHPIRLSRTSLFRVATYSAPSILKEGHFADSGRRWQRPALSSTDVSRQHQPLWPEC